MTDFLKPARKITWVLSANQSLASAGFIAAATINSILGAQLGGSDYWTGVPSAVYLLGAAFAASAWGYIMELIGRRNSLTLGLLIGVLVNTLVLFAIRAGSLPEFLAGMLLMGITNAAVILGRFAAAEVTPPEGRGKAISLVVWGGTFGAVVGPLLVGPMGSFVRRPGMEELAGPYLATLVLFALASVVVFIILSSAGGWDWSEHRFSWSSNHEQASLANLNGTADNVAVWTQTARNAPCSPA